MEKLTPKIWNALFTCDSYDAVAQQIPTANPRIHKWAGLHVISHYPISDNNFWFIREAIDYRFCLLIFELDEHTLKYFSETGGDEVQNPVFYKFNTEDELYKVCEEQKIEPSKFVPPWQANYPFE